MGNYQEARVKLANNQLNKLKFTAKNRARTTWTITKKRFQDEEFPDKVILTTQQKTEIRNAFANNVSMNVKLSKAQLSQIIQSAEFLGALLGKLAGPLMRVVVPFTKNILALLVTMASVSPICGTIQKKICGQGVVRAGKGITLVIWMKIWIIES